MPHDGDLIRVDLRELRKGYVDGAGHIPAALANQRTAQEQCLHGDLVAIRALRRAAPLAKAALIQRQRRLAARNDLPREIAVAAGNGRLIAGIFWLAQRNVHAFGMPLQTDHQRHLFPLGALRQEELAIDLHIRLARKHKAIGGNAIFFSCVSSRR